MKKLTPEAIRAELRMLLELTRRVGIDPMLTQGSTGNTSVKLDGVLWIKASGKWMADAERDDILLPLHLAVVMQFLSQGLDPAERYPNASLETALHAALPHRVVLHVHCVNTISWAVLNDAPIQLQPRLAGLRWQWIPYVESGLPLSREVERALSARPGTNLFVLGNHGLVIGADDAQSAQHLLTDVQERVAIVPREAPSPDYEALSEICRDSPWHLPDDHAVHALGTDAISQAILAGGLLYPCQAIFSDSTTPELFRAIPNPGSGHSWQSRYSDRPFLIIKGSGVVVKRSMASAELAMMRGLTEVVQRTSQSARLRYLTDEEVARISNQSAYRYRELAATARQGR